MIVGFGLAHNVAAGNAPGRVAVCGLAQGIEHIGFLAVSVRYRAGVSSFVMREITVGRNRRERRSAPPHGFFTIDSVEIYMV
jgi:hypothetical protein